MYTEKQLGVGHGGGGVDGLLLSSSTFNVYSGLELERQASYNLYYVYLTFHLGISTLPLRSQKKTKIVRIDRIAETSSDQVISLPD